jgi:Tfp pilus assembly protein PilE
MLVVMAIMALLFSQLLPSYHRYTLRANRADALVILNDIAQAQERYRAEHRLYTKDLTVLGYTIDGDSKGVLSSAGHYSVDARDCVDAIEPCTELTARAQGEQRKDTNDNKGHLSLDTRGIKKGW